MYTSNNKYITCRKHKNNPEKCTVCGGSLIKNHSKMTFQNLVSNKYLKINIIKNQQNIFNDHATIKNFWDNKNVPARSALPNRISQITSDKHVEYNNVCVEYITKFPFNDISSKKRNLSEIKWCKLRWPYRKIVASDFVQAAKFDGCRPLMVSLECSCNDNTEEVQNNPVTGQQKSMSTFPTLNNNNNNNVLQCACEQSNNFKQLSEKCNNGKSQGEKICSSNRCTGNQNINKCYDRENSIHLLPLAR